MNPILAQFQDQTVLVEEGRALWLESCLNAVSDRLEAIEKADDSSDDFWREGMSWLRPYVVKNGVLHVPVKGVLLNDFPYALGSWATGYEYIKACIKRGLDDSDVKGIALVVNSGGGMVAGNFDLVDWIHGERGAKPIRGFAAEHAYSAAYNIISAADQVTVARTGGVGSIGIVTVGIEYSKALEAAGITINIIRSKPDKMEGNPYEKLSKGAQERIQERVDEFHKQFVASVARNRGMEEAAVDATDAHTFMAHQAVENGLADAVGSFESAITAFEASFNEGEDQMAHEITQAEIDSAVEAAVATAKVEAKKEGMAEGVAAERARITGILNHDNAKDRPKAALAAAIETDMSVEQAGTFIGKLAAEVASKDGIGAPEGMLKSAMRGGNPGVEAGNEGDDPEDKEMSRAEKTRAMAGTLKV